MTPDVEQIKAALAERFTAQITGPIPPSWDAEWRRTAKWLAPTVAALVEQYAESYAADLRAEVERLRVEVIRPLRGDVHRLRRERNSAAGRADAAEADRDAYAAEKVRAALLDAAEVLEANRDAGASDPSYLLGLADAAWIVRRRADAS